MTASTITVDGLQFVALGGFNQSGTTYSSTGTVAVGFEPGAGVFTPILQLTGGVAVDADADPSFSVDGQVSAVLSGASIPLFQGSNDFDLDSLLDEGLADADGLTFQVAGVGFELGRIRLAKDAGDLPQIQLQGTLSVAGLTVAVDGPNSVVIAASGVSLTGVDATLNGSVAIGGVTFDADDLSIAYASTGGNDVFTVTGSTTFTASGSTVQVAWGGSTSKGRSTAGLVFQNGSIQSLDMAVQGAVTVASLDFTADDLVMTFTQASSTFTMTGGAGFQLVQDDANGTKPNDVSVEFGGTAGGSSTAGLVIVDGDLTRLDMTVDASFSLFGLTLASPGLVFEYQNDPSKSIDRFVMYGQVSLTSASQAFDGTNDRVFDGVAATLGDRAQPGLVVEEGVVEDVDVTLNGSFSLFGLNIAPRDLHVSYSRSTSTVEIVGDLKVKLAGAFETSADLDHGGIQIDTASGAVSLHGLKLDLSDVPLGAATIRQFELVFDQTPARTTFDASLVLAFSGGWSVGASIDFLNGEVDQIGVEYAAGTSQGIELGPSGLFLTSFSTTIENIATGVLTIAGSIAVDYGPHVTINGQSVAIISASGDFLIDASKLTLTDVQVTVADGIIGSGTGSLTADWGAGDYSLTASLSLLDGVFDLYGTVQFDSGGDFLLVASASVEVPEAVPVIGGDTIASMNFAFKYLNDGGSPSGFIAAWDTISILGWDQSVGFEYAIDGSIDSGSFSLIGDDGVQQVEDQLSLPPNNVNNQYGPQYVSGYFTKGISGLVPSSVLHVPPAATTVSLLMTSPSANFPGDVFLLLPPATAGRMTGVLALAPTLSPLNTPQPFTFPGTNVTANFIIRQDTPTTIAVLIQATGGQTLPAGEYALLYGSSWTSATPTATNSFMFRQPQVSAATAGPALAMDGTTLSVTGLIAAPLADDLTVSFYATTSPTGRQGIFLGAASPIKGGLSVAADGSFAAALDWKPSRAFVGSYYI
ncbi:hypothetical protein [Paludisphaera soli]|uniref:hypothetical protein n=1 Tax=Paludisphaera soli TaxID=2712865 RepID=UPI0013ED0688|nr:hypothetical protein [Paludisphaera soli]